MTPQVKHGLLCLAAIALCVCVKVNAQVIVSVQDGDWSSPSTWSGDIVPDSNSQVTILDHVTIPSEVELAVSDVTISDNGLLDISTGATVSIVIKDTIGTMAVTGTGMLQVNGTLVVGDYTDLKGTSLTNTTFNAGSTYRHLPSKERTIPLATWHPKSNFEIRGLTANRTMQSPNWAQTFGNLVYDCPNQGFSVSFKGLLAHIAGDFIVRNTNLGTLRLSQGEGMNLQIDGDALIEGPSEVWFCTTGGSVVTINGDFAYNSTSGASSYFATTGQSIFTVSGNFSMDAEHKIKLASSSEFGHTDLIVKGDFILTNGILDALNNNDNTTGGTGTIIFDGNGLQNVFTSRNSKTGFGGNLSFVIQPQVQLNLGESLLSNTTSGSLVVKGKLSLASANVTGVMQAGPDGNIDVVGPIQFDPGSVLELNGTAQQYISYGSLENAEVLINSAYGVSLLNDIQAGELTQQNGNLNVGAYSFSVTGDASLMNGDFSGSGTLIFNGSTDQLLAANGKTIANLMVAKSSPSNVVLTSPTSITGLLLIQSSDSDFISNGNLTLVSTSEGSFGTASIGPLPSGSSIVGDVNVQRYMAGIGDKYRYISSPITAATVQSLKNAVPVTGTFADPSTGPGINSTAPSLFEYDETINQWKPFPTSGLAINNFFEAGKGYCYFNWNNTTATLWNVAGEINQGDLDFNLTYTDQDNALDGWNLVGNPYPCAIRWDNGGGWERNNDVSMGIAVRDNALGGFRYWDGLGVGNLPDGRIALGQSFWVRATGLNPLLTIHESAKVVTGASFYRQGNSPDYVEVEVKMKGWSDKTFLRLREHASDLLDNFDIPKMANDNLSLSLMTDDSVSVAINAVQQIPCYLEIPLSVVMTQATSGDMTFSINSFGAFNGSDFHLFNEATGEKIKLEAEGSSIKLPSAVKVVNRLKLIIDSPVPEAPKISAPFIVCEGDSLAIQLESFQDGIAYKLFSPGLEMKADNKGIFNVGSNFLNQGENLFTLEASSACSTLVSTEPVVITKMVSHPPEVVSGQACQGEPVSLLASSEDPNASHHWYETSDDATTIHIGSDFITPILMKSKTYFVSTMDSLGCESRRVPVVAEVVSYDSAAIMLKDGELVSNYPDGNQWLFNGIEIPGEVNQTLVPSEPGVYTLEVRVGPCRLSDQFDYFITEIKSESEPNGIMVFPQPCNDRLFIRFRSEIKAELIDIFSSSGISVYNLCTFVCDNEICEMNTAHLPNGLYIIGFSKGKDPYFVRFIKE